MKTVDKKNLSRGSLIGITRLAELCRTVIWSDGFFDPNDTPMKEIFSCIPFDLPYLIFKVELAVKEKVSFRMFLLKFKKSTLPMVVVRFFTSTPNLYKLTSLFSVFMTSSAVKTNVT